MNYQISSPALELSPYIKHYWMMDSCLTFGNEHVHRIVPNGLTELIIYLDHKPLALDNKKNITEKIQLTGQLKNYYDIKISGKLSLFSVYFHPQGLSAFLDLPIKELYNHSIPLRYILKDTVDRLEEKLRSTQSFERRKCLADQFFLNLIKKRKDGYQQKRINYIIQHINNSRGVTNIDALAKDSCLSRKQFERTFSDHVGTSPKQFLKIVRYQNAIYCKGKKPDLSLTELAHDCGYYDQSHMINDFMGLTGLTPGQYFKACPPYSDYFQ
jgi:AraC-like DNA-binding protein